MKSVLLTHSYFYKLDRKQWRFKQPYPPLGTLLVAQILKNLNIQVNFQDAGLKENETPIIDEIKSTHYDM